MNKDQNLIISLFKKGINSTYFFDGIVEDDDDLKKRFYVFYRESEIRCKCCKNKTTKLTKVKIPVNTGIFLPTVVRELTIINSIMEQQLGFNCNSMLMAIHEESIVPFPMERALDFEYIESIGVFIGLFFDTINEVIKDYEDIKLFNELDALSEREILECDSSDFV